MQAIEVEKVVGRRRARGSTWHFLNDRDPGRTLCGLSRLELAVVEELERDGLPEVNGCRGCLRATGELARERRTRSDVADPGRVTAEPAAGRLRTTGPLSHGTRSGRGQHRLR